MKIYKISQFSSKRKNLSEEEQLRLVKKDKDAIYRIINPSEEAQLEAVKQDGNSICCIGNPSIEVQMEAVKQNGRAIRFIRNPSIEVQIAAITGKEAYYVIENIKEFIPNQHPDLSKEYLKWIVNKINE